MVYLLTETRLRIERWVTRDSTRGLGAIALTIWWVARRIVFELRQFDWLFIFNNQLKWRNSGTILRGTDPTVNATASWWLANSCGTMVLRSCISAARGNVFFFSHFLYFRIAYYYVGCKPDGHNITITIFKQERNHQADGNKHTSFVAYLHLQLIIMSSILAALLI